MVCNVPQMNLKQFSLALFKRRVSSSILTAGAAICVMFSAEVGGASPSAADPADVFGVAHVDGKYFLTTEDFLNEGAGQISAVGSKVIKLYLTPRRYPWN